MNPTGSADVPFISQRLLLKETQFKYSLYVYIRLTLVVSYKLIKYLQTIIYFDAVIQLYLFALYSQLLSFSLLK